MWVLSFFCLCLIFLFRHWLQYWRRQNVPCVERKYPYIFGNISGREHLALQLNGFYKNNRTDYPIIGFYMFFKPMVLIVDLELVQLVLKKEFQHFRNRGMFNTDKDPLSQILGTMEHDKWKPLRQQLTPAFSPAKIKQMFDTMGIIGHGLVRGLNEMISVGGETVEIRDLFSRFSTDVIGRATIGIECGALHNNCTTEIREQIQQAMLPYVKFPWNMLKIAYPRLSRFLRFRKHPEDVSNFFVDVVDQTIKHRRDNNERRNDFIQLLIDCNLTTNEAAALTYDFLSAGYSDVTSTISYCLYELSLNQDIQQTARNEIQDILEQHNGELTYDVYNEMAYCKKIIKETLRKHPVAGNITRIASENYIVPNTDFTIPKGMRIYIPIFAIHHDERFYTNPEEFNPDREFPSNAFLPFGDGPRKCMGYRFAELLVGVGLVSLLRNFKFSTCDRTQTPIKYSTTKNTLVPSEGVWLKVHRI